MKEKVQKSVQTQKQRMRSSVTLSPAPSNDGLSNKPFISFGNFSQFTGGSTFWRASDGYRVDSVVQRLSETIMSKWSGKQIKSCQRDLVFLQLPIQASSGRYSLLVTCEALVPKGLSSSLKVYIFYSLHLHALTVNSSALCKIWGFFLLPTLYTKDRWDTPEAKTAV